jgi:phage terminase small subunit
MKSQQQKNLEGTARNDRKKGTDKAQSMKLVKTPILPNVIKEVLNERQAILFKNAVKLLIDLGVVTKLDIVAVVAYAVALDNWLTAVKNLNDNSQIQVYKQNKGNNISGYFTAFEKMSKALTEAEKKIGFNMYIRERMTTYTEGELKEELSPFERLMEEISKN